jgi:ABC-type branched-subunit amino acid transport system ATPase component
MTMPTVIPLQLEAVSRSFGGLRAVSRVDLVVRAGEILGLIGPNGAGKTTLMRTITGLHRPSAGTSHPNGAPIYTLLPHLVSERAVILVPAGGAARPPCLGGRRSGVRPGARPGR